MALFGTVVGDRAKRERERMGTLQTRRRPFTPKFRVGVDIPTSSENGGTGGPAVDNDYNSKEVWGSFDYCPEVQEEEERVNRGMMMRRSREQIDPRPSPLDILLIAAYEVDGPDFVEPEGDGGSSEEEFIPPLENLSTRLRHRRAG